MKDKVSGISSEAFKHWTSRCEFCGEDNVIMVEAIIYFERGETIHPHMSFKNSSIVKGRVLEIEIDNEKHHFLVCLDCLKKHDTPQKREKKARQLLEKRDQI